MVRLVLKLFSNESRALASTENEFNVKYLNALQRRSSEAAERHARRGKLRRYSSTLPQERVFLTPEDDELASASYYDAIAHRAIVRRKKKSMAITI